MDSPNTASHRSPLHYRLGHRSNHIGMSAEIEKVVKKLNSSVKFSDYILAQLKCYYRSKINPVSEPAVH